MVLSKLEASTLFRQREDRWHCIKEGSITPLPVPSALSNQSSDFIQTAQDHGFFLYAYNGTDPQLHIVAAPIDVAFTGDTTVDRLIELAGHLEPLSETFYDFVSASNAGDLTRVWPSTLAKHGASVLREKHTNTVHAWESQERLEDIYARDIALSFENLAKYKKTHNFLRVQEEHAHLEGIQEEMGKNKALLAWTESYKKLDAFLSGLEGAVEPGKYEELKDEFTHHAIQAQVKGIARVTRVLGDHDEPGIVLMGLDPACNPVFVEELDKIGKSYVIVVPQYRPRKRNSVVMARLTGRDWLTMVSHVTALEKILDLFGTPVDIDAQAHLSEDGFEGDRYTEVHESNLTYRTPSNELIVLNIINTRQANTDGNAYITVRLPVNEKEARKQVAQYLHTI